MKSNLKNTLSHVPRFNQPTAIALSAGAVCIAGCGILLSDTISHVDQSASSSKQTIPNKGEVPVYDMEYIEAYRHQWLYSTNGDELFRSPINDPDDITPILKEEKIPLK